jgi:hypothetical protein
MPMRPRHLISALILALTAGTASLAPAQQAPATQPYSATAIHAFPGQPETSGQIVKSGQNMRLEFDQNGARVVQILRPADGVMLILNPATRTYVEIRGPSVPAPASDGYTSPCPDQGTGPQCQLIGTDTVSGIAVERWQIASQPQAKPLIILWDATRRRALRQDFPDGSAMAMAFKAMEDINGRKTEHWTLRLTAPGQPDQNGDWWFDPELRVVVREDLPTGETRRLENIVVGQVDAGAFQVPQGWQKQAAPALSTPQAPQPAPAGN